MEQSTRKLNFVLPDDPFHGDISVMTDLTRKLDKKAKLTGRTSKAFEFAQNKLFNALEKGIPIESVLEKRIDVRALGMILETLPSVNLSANVFNKIDQITQYPTALFFESILQYYLMHFTSLPDVESVSEWIIKARKKRGIYRNFDDKLFSKTGPNWLAMVASKKNIELIELSQKLNIERYRSGQFIKKAMRIYYINTLKAIDVNKHHSLLDEVSKRSVYESRFSENELLGHLVLKTLIKRAPEYDIHNSWLQTILTIAGDPRVSINDPQYLKWWSFIDESLLKKVKVWLSGYDLKVFLDALEDYSNDTNNTTMKRSFPARKKFLEGLYKRELIKGAKLYISHKMEGYLKQKYKPEHLPEYSILRDTEGRSIIYLDMGKAHVIEGTHNCQIWLYKNLDPSAIVLQQGKQERRYEDLTLKLRGNMERNGCPPFFNTIHSPYGIDWQIKTVNKLRQLGLSIDESDVLTDTDYLIFKRRMK